MLGRNSVLCANSSVLATMAGIFPRPNLVYLNTSTRSRLSNRINAVLSSSKLNSPDRMPPAVSKFIIHHPWSIEHVNGSQDVYLRNTIFARSVDIHWSILPAPSGGISISTGFGVPFTISVADNLTPQGLVFECRTQKRASYRYVIERITSYRSLTERGSRSSYKGPAFVTLDPALQAAFDETLHDWGISTEVVDFIEASSQYYNNMEYINWLCNINDFISK